MMTEKHLPDMLVKGWPKSQRKATKGFAYDKGFATKEDMTFVLSLAHQIIRAIFKGWQHFRERSWTDMIPAGRSSKSQSFMRPLQVVYISPGVEGTLTAKKVCEATLSEYLSFKGAMEPFILTLGLWMVGPAMTYRNIQPKQPDREGSIGLPAAISPGAAIVHEHALRQAVAPEDSAETLFHSLPGLIATGLKAQSKPGMVIEDCERVTAPIRDCEMSLKVHLPQLIRRIMLKSLPGAVLSPFSRLYHASPLENGSDGAGAGDLMLTNGRESSFYLTATPGRMLGTHLKNSLLISDGVRAGLCAGRRDWSTSPSAPWAW